MIYEKIRDLVAKQFVVDADSLSRETSFTDDLNADSLDAVELNMALEEKFGTAIPDDKLAEMKTVGDIYNYLTENA